MREADMPDISAQDYFEQNQPPRRPWDDDPELREKLLPHGTDPYQPDPYAWL
jgi:hypothetical protein